MYNTKGRKNVIAFLNIHKNTAFTVKEIYDKMTADNEITVVPFECTLYMILNKLTEEGVVNRDISDNREYRYALYNQKPLLNVRCKLCGRVFEPNSRIYDLVNELTSQNEPLESVINAEVTGICKKCK